MTAFSGEAQCVADGRAEALAALAQEIDACRACPLGSTRTRSVPGEGRPDAELLFVGEAPGASEDSVGRPFVGAAGKLLDLLLGLTGRSREDVFVLNVVKCRPPDNRDPEPEEVAACAQFLQRQLSILSPVLVAPLGRHALRTFAPTAKISAVHGTPLAEGVGLPLGATLFPLYHPAAALHNGALRPTLERDMGALVRELPAARVRWASARGVAEEARLVAHDPSAEREQLRLFESEAE
ncbi:MAG: uracil-DNA glycosylase family protein [Candidatus Limnocylindrus sp.]